MGKGKSFREPRRRGFDDENFSMRDIPERRPSYPPARPLSGSAPAEGPPVGAVVKWFNAQKGFGFVELDDGSGDVFLHATVLEAAGHQAVSPGAKLRVQIGQGAKGRQITAVLDVQDSGVSVPAAPRGEGLGSRSGRDRPDSSATVEMTGTVKWFNGSKGFGFVQPEDGGRDVFVHITVVNRAGLDGLADGQAVSMRVAETPKGREAVAIAAVD